MGLFGCWRRKAQPIPEGEEIIKVVAERPRDGDDLRLRRMEAEITALRYDFLELRKNYNYQFGRSTESENRATEARHLANKLASVIGRYEARFKRLEAVKKKARK